jgi:hypothetical protein
MIARFKANVPVFKPQGAVCGGRGLAALRENAKEAAGQIAASDGETAV